MIHSRLFVAGWLRISGLFAGSRSRGRPAKPFTGGGVALVGMGLASFEATCSFRLQPVGRNRPKATATQQQKNPAFSTLSFTTGIYPKSCRKFCRVAGTLLF